MITVVSACYGGYDAPAAPLEQDVDVQWVMVTDGSVSVPEPWKSVVEHRSHLHPRMAAKIPKCLPHRYADTNFVVWLDASAVILRPDFVSTCVAALGDGDVAMWPHPQRDDIVEEAEVSAGMTKYAGQPVREQAAHYTACGHPRRFGLWATGCMTWGQRGRTFRAGAQWLNQQAVWTYQDQISWPVMVWHHELDVRPMPGSLWDKQQLIFRPHASEA